MTTKKNYVKVLIEGNTKEALSIAKEIGENFDIDTDNFKRGSKQHNKEETRHGITYTFEYKNTATVIIKKEFTAEIN